MKRAGMLIATLLLLLLLSPAGTAVADFTYVIQPGDTLFSIAVRFDVTVTAIVEANNIINPNLIYSGQQLIIPSIDGGDGGGDTQPPPPPPPAGNAVYVVQPGDTLFAIAIRHGVTVTAIVLANGLDNPNLIYVGQELVIPGASGGGTPPGATATPLPPPPPAATPTPPAPTFGANLLPNPSFENGYTNLYGAPELQVPVGWQMEIDEGTQAPGTGLVFLRPESRVTPRWGVPPAEQSLFFWNGDWALKVFKGAAPISFRLYTFISLQPGTYRFVANYFPDLVQGYNPDGSKVWAPQALAGEVSFIRTGGGVNWTPVTVGIKNTMTQTFTVTSAGTIRVGVGWRTRYIQANNGFFIDDWSLQQIN